MGVRSLNNPLQEFLDTFVRSGTDAVNPAPPPFQASGGVISDYVSGSTIYRAHIFTSSGTFSVTSGSGNIEYLLVAGGGAGGSGNFRLCGGGGAGGLLSNHPDVPASAPTGATRQAAYSVSPGPYTVSIGAGGAGARNGTIVDGSASNFYPTPVSYPSLTYLRAFGGGGGGGNPNPGSNGGNNTSGNPGGSGGGNTEGGPATFAIGGGGSGTPGQGSNGGRTGSGLGAAGGGGAGEAGCQDDNGPIPSNPPGAYANGGYGGDGMQVRIAGSPLSDQPVGTPGTNPGGGYFAGGGGGSYQPNTNAPLKGVGGEGGGGYGIVWPGGVNPFGQDGLSGTGGGGGGAAEQTGPARGGNGGSGILVVRYQIGSLTATAKATGGAISYYGGKTIHTFTSTGTFTAPSPLNPTPLSVEYVVVAGGGAGGSQGGGGGAGGYLTSTTTVPSGSSYTVTVGAGGVGNDDRSVVGPNGSPSVFGPGPITATGGGGGGARLAGGLSSGGSGGGTNPNSGQSAGSGTPGQGNPGGSGSPGPVESSGGGGGSSQIGGSGSSNVGGAGGNGSQVPSSFQNPIVVFGSPNYYLAGGGGGSVSTSPTGTGGTGGLGGGGNGNVTYNAPGTSGITNTGGGGGGGSYTYFGGNGGSGIVLIAYPS